MFCDLEFDLEMGGIVSYMYYGIGKHVPTLKFLQNFTLQLQALARQTDGLTTRSEVFVL